MDSESVLKRISQLENAIRDANGALKVGEGISLIYYSEYFDHADSVKVIKELIDG
jgi:hypothetical protein